LFRSEILYGTEVMNHGVVDQDVWRAVGLRRGLDQRGDLRGIA
jgi:hypothetical protein